MRQWFVGSNNYWFTASIWLEEAPFVLIFMEWLVMHICDAFTLIRLPKIHELWHIYVCSNVTDLRHKYTKSIDVALPYFYLKKKFPEEFNRDNAYEYDEEVVEDNRSIAWDYSNKYMEYSRKYKNRIDTLIDKYKQ